MPVPVDVAAVITALLRDPDVARGFRARSEALRSERARERDGIERVRTPRAVAATEPPRPTPPELKSELASRLEATWRHKR